MGLVVPFSMLFAPRMVKKITFAVQFDRAIPY